MKAFDHWMDIFPPTDYSLSACRGTDYEEEGGALYSLCRYAMPTEVLELGTRYGVSTRILVDALSAGIRPWRFTTVDPDPTDPEVLALPIRFVRVTGQEFFTSTTGLYHFIHIDTDPHSFAQTWEWLETYAKSRLTPGGVIAFHDFNGPVGEAVHAWLKDQTGWKLDTWSGKYGLGALWKAGRGTGDGTHQPAPNDGATRG